MKRPFWLHQLVEYIIGAGLISQGIQSSKPAIPAVLGLLVLINAATVAGPLAAFRGVSKATHRIFDIALIALMVVAGVVSGDTTESTTKLMLIGVAAVMGVVVWRTNFVQKQRRAPVSAEGGRSTEVGRLAGRGAANAVRFYKARKGQ